MFVSWIVWVSFCCVEVIEDLQTENAKDIVKEKKKVEESDYDRSNLEHNREKVPYFDPNLQFYAFYFSQTSQTKYPYELDDAIEVYYSSKVKKYSEGYKNSIYVVPALKEEILRTICDYLKHHFSKEEPDKEVIEGLNEACIGIQQEKGIYEGE